MKLLDDFPLGRFVPGESFLHRVDPRIKTVATLILVIGVFSARGWDRLLVMSILAGSFMGICGIGWRTWWRALASFRWFLLFTVCLYLLFSPGRTLWGVPWLSRDGLERGVFVSSQLLLAIGFSSLLTFTTEPRQIAAGFLSLLSPLEKWTLPVGKAADRMLLVLHCIPIFREEARSVVAESRASGREQEGKLAFARTVVSLLILRLADRADQWARESVAAGESGKLEPLKPLSGRETGASLLVFGLAGYFLWGMGW